jgi:hypothetical protein
MMMLGSVSLPNLAWTDKWSATALSTPIKRRLDGGIVIYPRKLLAGRSITLEAPANQPLTVAQAKALAVLAEAEGAVYTLSMPLQGYEFSVMFDWSGGQALELSDLIDYADPIDSDPVTGIIHLITV